MTPIQDLLDGKWKRLTYNDRMNLLNSVQNHFGTKHSFVDKIPPKKVELYIWSMAYPDKAGLVKSAAAICPKCKSVVDVYTTNTSTANFAGWYADHADSSSVRCTLSGNRR